MTTTIKGKILRDDLRHYDGVNRTATRKESTGTVTGLRVGNDVDVLAVYGDGENYNDATIRSAVTAIGSAAATLNFAPGTWTISANTTIPANLPCRIPAGCVFDVASGVTLTFNGPVIQDYSTWTSGSGTVTTNANRVINGGLTINGTALTATATELNTLDGITASTAELNILDGVTATAAELNILDGVTSTASELNELDASAASVTGYESGVREYWRTGSALTYNAVTNLTLGATETIGPTGSGADNIWSDMDAIPSDAKAVILDVQHSVQGNSTVAEVSGRTRANSVIMTLLQFYNYSSSVNPTHTQICKAAAVDLDASNRFSFSYESITGTVLAHTVTITLRGFIV